MNKKTHIRQEGITLVGLVFIFAILGMIVILGLKVAPTVSEFFSIKNAIVAAKASGTTVREIQTAFDKQAEVGYIESISGKDLEITKVDGETEVSFAYQKKIPLVGPASLLLEYQGTTAKKPLAAKKSAE